MGSMFKRQKDGTVILWGSKSETGTHLTVKKDGNWHQTSNKPKIEFARGKIDLRMPKREKKKN